MRKECGACMRRALVVIGVSLLVGAIVMLLFWRCNIVGSEKGAERRVDTLRSLIPQPEDAIPEERRDNAMSVLSVDGVDFVGIIEMPRYGSALPVGAEWGKSSKYPCRFGGSVYDRTLQIGATTQKGQYDFYRELSVGDAVVFTDVEGNRYTYEVTSLRTEKTVDRDVLGHEDAPLTLFIKNIYSFEYLVVFCDIRY